MNIENITLEDLKAAFGQILPTLNINLTCEIRDDDMWPDIGQCLFLDDTWQIGVSTEHCFIVAHSVSIPGCRTLPNGDLSYMDDVDLVDDGNFYSIKEVIHMVIGGYIRQQIDNELMQIDLDQQANDTF